MAIAPRGDGTGAVLVGPYVSPVVGNGGPVVAAGVGIGGEWRDSRVPRCGPWTEMYAHNFSMAISA